MPPPHILAGRTLTADDIEDGESETLTGFEGVASLSRPRRHIGDPADRPLNPRERLFVQEYLVDLNATAAAGRAGYRWPSGTGFRLIRRAHVCAAIAEAMDARARRVGVSAERVLQELAWVAFSRLSDLARWGADEDGKAFLEVTPSEVVAQLDGPDAAVAEVKQLAGGALRIRLHDKMPALTLLARHMGLLVDRVEVSGPEGGPVEVGSARELTLMQFLSGVPRELRDEMRGLILRMEGAKGGA